MEITTDRDPCTVGLVGCNPMLEPRRKDKHITFLWKERHVSYSVSWSVAIDKLYTTGSTAFSSSGISK